MICWLLSLVFLETLQLQVTQCRLKCVVADFVNVCFFFFFDGQFECHGVKAPFYFKVLSF